jgi:hypothetical protein
MTTAPRLTQLSHTLPLHLLEQGADFLSFMLCGSEKSLLVTDATVLDIRELWINTSAREMNRVMNVQ